MQHKIMYEADSRRQLRENTWTASVDELDASSPHLCKRNIRGEELRINLAHQLGSPV